MSTSGLSKLRLARMHDIMAGYVERREVPGLVTLVSRRGEVHVEVIGNMGYEDKHYCSARVLDSRRDGII